MKSAIIVDSTAGLAPEYANHPDVYQVTLSLNFPDGTTYEDTIEEKAVKDFYNHLESSKKLPTTSQPKPGDYITILDEIVEKGYDTVFLIHLSSALSGTFQTSLAIANDYQDKLAIHAIDSKGTSVIIERMVKYALAFFELDLAPEIVEEKLQWFADEAHIYVMVDDLEALAKGGRVSVGSAWLGNMLRIIPVLEFKDDGTVDLHEKIRTYSKVQKRWSQLIDEAIEKYPNGIEVAFAHGDAEGKANEMKDYIQKQHPKLEFNIAYLTPVLGTHGGKGCLGMGVMPKISI